MRVLLIFGLFNMGAMCAISLLAMVNTINKEETGWSAVFIIIALTAIWLASMMFDMLRATN